MNMRTTYGIAVGILAVATMMAGAQQQPAKSPVTITPSTDSTAPHNWTTEQILTCTVSDCWQLAGKNEATFFDIIQQTMGSCCMRLWMLRFVRWELGLRLRQPSRV
jgi:hypothetical protein